MTIQSRHGRSAAFLIAGAMALSCRGGSGAKTGTLRGLELERERRSLLDGRLTVQLPGSAKSWTPPGSLVPKVGGDDAYSGIDITVRDEQLFMRVEELFLTADRDFRAAVQRIAGVDGAQLAPVTFDAPGMHGLKVPATDQPSRSEDLVTLFGIYVVQPDTTVQFVAFYANRKAAVDYQGCTAIADRVTRTFAPGPRKLSLLGGPRRLKLPATTGELIVQLPHGFIQAMEPGPDYLTYEIRPLAALGTDVGYLRVNIGASAVLVSTRKRIH